MRNTKSNNLISGQEGQASLAGASFSNVPEPSASASTSVRRTNNNNNNNNNTGLIHATVNLSPGPSSYSFHGSVHSNNNNNNNNNIHTINSTSKTIIMDESQNNNNNNDNDDNDNNNNNDPWESSGSDSWQHRPSELDSPLVNKVDDHGNPITLKKVNSSVTASVLNLSNTILGAGVLSLPFAVRESGTIVGMILFLVFGALSALGLQFLCHAAREVPHSDFNKLSMCTMPKAKILVDAAVAIKCFGVGTSYMIVSGDLIPEVVDFLMHKIKGGNIPHQGIYKERRIWISVAVITLILPIVRWKYLDSLRVVSSFCLGFFAFVIITIFLYAYGPSSSFDPCQAVSGPCPGSTQFGPSNAKDFLGVLPLFIFGFTCHQNAFTITNELKNPTHRRLDTVVFGAVLCCIIVYGSASFAGYQTFGTVLNKDNSDVLKLYPETWMTTIVRLLLSMNLCLSYPLQCNPCRNSLSQLIYGKSALELTNKQFYILTYGIACSSWALALIVNSLGVVLAIVGSTGSTAISYILPGMFYYLMFKNDTQNRRKYVALALAILGCCIVPFALTMVFLSGEASG